MPVLKVIFYSSLLILFYSYIGYGILLWIINKIKPPQNFSSTNNGYTPLVTLVVAAYNEEAFIEKKIANTLQLNYPKDKIEFLFISDGSSDQTPQLIEKHGEIKHLYKPAREGKVAAIKRALNFVNNPIVIFSDANTLLNQDCIKHIVKHYADPLVGGVAGEKKVSAGSDAELAGAGEGLYWKYESFLKKMDSDFYTVVGAAGEIFSVRTELYQHPGNDTLLDDFVISLNVCSKGFRVIYEPMAYAIEDPSASITEEKKRKIRISAGGFQSIVRLKHLLNIFKYKKLSFQYISHRVLRWTICPLLIPIVFILNLYLYLNSEDIIIQFLFWSQLVFYTLALMGYLFSLKKIKFGPAYAAYYFIFINYCLYMGFFKYLKNTQSVLWEKAERKKT